MDVGPLDPFFFSKMYPPPFFSKRDPFKESFQKALGLAGTQDQRAGFLVMRMFRMRWH